MEHCTFFIFSYSLSHFYNYFLGSYERKAYICSVSTLGRVCHKCDDMPFFSLLHSANTATSFCQLSHFILQTNPSHSAYEFESSRQRSHIFKPAQSNLQASAIESSSQRSRMYRLNETYELAQWRTWFHQRKRLRLPWGCWNYVTTQLLMHHDVAISASRRSNRYVVK